MMFISWLNAGSNMLKMRQARRKRNPRNALVYFKIDKTTSIVPTAKVVQTSDLLKIGQEVTVNWTTQQQFTGVIKFLSDSNAELLQKQKQLVLGDDKPYDFSEAVDLSDKLNFILKIGCANNRDA
ncbi:uncharacterized protein LOC117112019 [Anneissia japonica]|uniref:uncharacterized protein LOC117112019 n=1 Tax=Anneissia japonica TaxID=1529436 RepID=UPI001425973B|nr:uncharacterized protein LOC117112019 [Anneissia japonica]